MSLVIGFSSKSINSREEITMGKRYNNYEKEEQVAEEEVKPVEENFMEAPVTEAVKEEVKPVETVPIAKPVNKDNSIKRRTVTL